MKETTSANLGHLHTWGGLICSALLFAVFWTGTLVVYDREIDRWMMPQTRLVVPAKDDWLKRMPLLDDELSAGWSSWIVTPPSEREPTLRITMQKRGQPSVSKEIDVETGRDIPKSGTLGGRGFFYDFHTELRLKWNSVGLYTVCLLGVWMLALIVSGVLIHKRIFLDFFLLRTASNAQRLSLDLHNVSGVIGVPFHVMITATGVMAYASNFFPAALSAYDGRGVGWAIAYQQEALGGATDFSQRASGERTGGLRLSFIVAEAEKIWGAYPLFFRIYHPGDRNGYVEVRRERVAEVTMNYERLYFAATTGELLHRFSTKPEATAARFITGLHVIQFRHWVLRAFYFFLGVSGCVLIATGMIFWVESRRKRHAQLGRSGGRIVQAITVGSVTGIIAATLAYLAANRLLPVGSVLLGEGKASLEVWSFYLAWLAAFGHAWLRTDRAWIEQCYAIALLAVAAVTLNWISTGDHLLRSTFYPHLWPVAGVDLALITTAILSAATGRALGARSALREAATHA